MPQRDNTIEQNHRLEGLIAYAEGQKDWDEVERLKERLKKLLEQMAAMEQMKAKLDALRMTIYNLMKDEEIDCIDSELAIVTRTRSSFVDSIKRDKLKKEMPEVYDKYLKKTLRKGTLHVRLVTQKE